MFRRDKRADRRGWAWVVAALAGLAAGCSSAELTTSCPAGTTLCEGACVVTATTDAHCGACGAACAASEYCDAGTCAPFCGAGRAACGATCVNVASNPSACGGCDTPCAAGLFCDGGACSATCGGVLCPGTDGAMVCVRTATDPDHCGACGQACAEGQECVDGSCRVACPPGRLLCGSECVDTQTDARHCGGCGSTCESGAACVEGSCAGASCSGPECPCPGTTERCGGGCVDTATSVFHCGGCDVVCATAQTCVAGGCACPSGGLLCGDTCVDADADSANCGACGNACSGGKSCVSGTCTCPEGLVDCDGQCVNVESSPIHCGSCNSACVGKEVCEEGVCFFDVGDDCGGAAKSVSITKVALYQAVESLLFDQGAVVAEAQRSVDTIAGRPALVRVFADVEATFAARTLSARVYVDNGDIDPEVYFQKKALSSDSVQATLDSTFNVSIPAEAILPESEVYVELVECGEPPTGTDGVTRVPTEGTIPLEARTTGPIHVAFLPFRYNDFVPDTSEAAIRLYANEVMKQYGTTNVVTSVLPTYGSYTGTPNLSSLLDDVRAKRAADRPPSNVYYYGLVKSTSTFQQFCQGGCTTGVAYLPGNSANFRAGIGIGYANATSAGTFAHELGHNHNRNHAPCGNPDGPDANYPYSGGLIGKWGYDYLAAQLKNPASTTDLMGYCNPTWVSDYNYNAMTNVVATVSQLAYEVRGPERTWKALRVTASGAEWTHPVEMSDPAPSEADVWASVYADDGTLVDRVRAHRYLLSENLGYLLLVPPRQSGWWAIGLDGDIAAPYPSEKP